jgi:dinuclear metal center YbgI/SA1388 family protein
MPTVKDILAHFEKIAPFSLQENYDNSGLQIGNPSAPVSGILIALDCLEKTVDEAIEKKCNLIVCHHPLIFRGIKSITGKNYTERIIIKAIQHQIAILAVHTNLDNVNNGVNAIISEKLKLQNTKILKPKESTLLKLVTFVPSESHHNVLNALFKAGCGEIGNYSEASFHSTGTGTFMPNELANPHIGTANQREEVNENKIEVILERYKLKNALEALWQSHPYEEVAYDLIPLENMHSRIGSGMVGELPQALDAQEFIHSLKTIFRVPVIKHTALIKNEIKKVAVCGGSGFFLLFDAVRSGADIYITSDVKYHDFFDADGKIILADIGHYESEQFTSELLHKTIHENYPDTPVFIARNETNPVHYS